MRKIVITLRGLAIVLGLVLAGACTQPFVPAGDVSERAAVSPPWQAYKAYQTGEYASYQDVDYRCRQSHTSLPGWEPPYVLALWEPSTPQVTIPAVPSGLSATASSSSAIAVTWQASAGASSYDLEVDGVVRTGVASPWQHTGLAAQTTHVYKVRAVNSAGASAWSSAVSATTLAQDTIPAVPSGLVATPISTSAIRVSWQASTGATRYDLQVDGVTHTGFSSPWTHSGLAAASTHTYRVRAANSAGNSAWSTSVSATTHDQPPVSSKLLVGYWHNFDNGTGFIRLRDVPDAWDVINVAFVDTAGDRATASFTPFQGTVSDFQSDVAYLQGRGKKVVISIGGQNGSLILSTTALRDAFVNSMKNIIDTYGFDGIDLDVETGVSVSSGDINLDNPTTPAIVNLIAATRTICDYYGSEFILSMAPEIAYVQGGLVAFGGPWGGYLPIIHKLRDKLSWLHVQHYNAGGNPAPDGRNYNQGTADFQVAMADMVLFGFNIGGNPAHPFPPLREDQVMIGLPATGPAAPSGGYISPNEMYKALNYIIKGQSFGGTYVIRKSGAYPGFRGLMTWSINWDEHSGNEFSNSYRTYFAGL